MFTMKNSGLAVASKPCNRGWRADRRAGDDGYEAWELNNERFLMSESSSSSSSGIGFFGLLGIVFITLRLCGVIDWSWWWVLAPIWIPIVVVVPILIIAYVAIALLARRGRRH